MEQLLLAGLVLDVGVNTDLLGRQPQPMPQFRIAPEMHGWAGGGPLALPITHPLPAHFATDLVPTLDTHTQPRWP